MRATFRRLLGRLTNALMPARAEAELSREVEAHIALLVDEHMARGLTPAAARVAALRQFGAVERIKGAQRDARSFAWLDDARQDLGAAWRTARQRPGATAAATLLTALAIASTTTLFSLAYGVLFRPLPWADSDQLVRLDESRGGRRGRIPNTISNAAYHAWRARHDTVSEIGGWSRWRTSGQSATMTGSGEAVQFTAASVTPSLFALLRVHPAQGRLFVEDDAVPGAEPTMLISHGLWQRAFGGRADVVGQLVRIDGRPHTVIGVMPPAFAFPDATTQAWLPLHVMPVVGEGNVRRVMIFGVMARLRPGVTAAQASSEATTRARTAPDLAQAALALWGDNGEIVVTATPAQAALTSDVRPGLLVLLAGVALLFVTAVASLVNVQAARALQRRREMAVRAALGAGTSRIARQWVVESVGLGVAGAALGLALAAGLHGLLPLLLPTDFPRLGDIRLDGRVMAITAAVTVLTSVLCGAVPAWLARREGIADVLAQDGLAPVGGTLRSPAVRIRTALMTLQVGIACVLLVVTSLLARSLVKLLDADRGYDPRNVLTARIPLPQGSTFAQHRAVLDGVGQRLAAVPRVTQVAFGNALPFVASGQFRGITMPAPTDPSRTLEVQTMLRAVTPGYRGALGLRLAAGRFFDATDSADAPPVVVVNRSFATQYLEGAAIGRRLRLRIGGRDEWDVVGVVDDMRQGGLTGVASPAFGGVVDPPQPEIFFSHAQWKDQVSEVIVVIRTEGDPTDQVSLLRSAVRDADATLAVDNVMTMDQRIATSLASPRLYVAVLGTLGACALAVAGIGLFGVLSHATAQRTREIGVRTALGATGADVVALVATHALASVGVGLVAGLAVASAGAGLLANQIYGVAPTDVVSFVAALVALVVMSLLACAAPIVRALRISPLTALRSS